MDSRNLLQKSKQIIILLDSDSLNVELEKRNRDLIALLDYTDINQFIFIRSPSSAKNDLTTKISEYELFLPENYETKPRAIGSLTIQGRENSMVFPFGYKMAYIPAHAKDIYGKEDVDESQYNAVKQILIQATFSQLAAHSSNKTQTFLFFTENKDLLKKRLPLEHQFGFPLNIMTLKEGVQFLDLVLKRNEQYLLRGHFYINKGYWYWLSLRLKVPHLSKFTPISTAISYRAEYSLMALDEMGIQFYKGVNNDTKDNSLYHFNYLITLISGIFDNLALITDQDLQISHKDIRQIGLSKSGSKPFLKEIRERRPDIRKHINNYVDFINLIYSFREDVVHRAGLPSVVFHDSSYKHGWNAQFIKISEEIARMIELCGDGKRDFDKFSEWGVYKSGNVFFVTPYILGISLVRTILQFTDIYLDLLGYPLSSDVLKSDQDLDKHLKIFEIYRLGI